MWQLSSRIHPLNQFPNGGVRCYVKRDDELGCGISGSKLRKYASLLPYLLEQRIRHLIIIAGPQSNNLLAALQIAREFQFNLSVFLLKPKQPIVQGNFKLSQLFLEEQEVIWVEREHWSEVNCLAEQHLEKLQEAAFIVYEGASVSQALEGAMSIAADIVRNEQSVGIQFQHIFVDAGTGFSASALIHGLKQLQHPAQIHVLLLADNEAFFRRKLYEWTGENPADLHCFYPDTAKSFGSVNQTIKNEIRRLAKEEGILADPIYAAKLFHGARKAIETKKLQGNVLIIHSGGTLTMAGFSFN